MSITPTVYATGTYSFSRARGPVDVLANPDGGFRVDTFAYGSDSGINTLVQSNVIPPTGHGKDRITYHIDFSTRYVDLQISRLEDGQIGGACIKFPDNGSLGEARAFHFDDPYNGQVTLSAKGADCYAMFEQCALAGGGLIALWGQERSGQTSVLFRTVSADNDPLGQPIAVSTAAGHDQSAGIMDVLADGTVVIGWDDRVAGASTADLTIGLYDEAGQAKAAPLIVAGHDVGAATAVHALVGGGYVVAWDDAVADRSTFQLFAADGTATGGPLAAIGDITGDVTELRDGGFVLESRHGGTTVIQCYGADGAAVGGTVAASGVLETLGDGRIAVATLTSFIILDPREYAIDGTAAADVIYARLDGSEIFGMEGNDQLFGGDAADILRGGHGADRLQGLRGDDQLFGSDGRDRLDGGDGDDRVDGGSGNDDLVGGDGTDVLNGGGGKDTMSGGGGADVFVFERQDDSGTLRGRDLIYDFEVRRDRIDVSAIDADRTHAGQQAFTFIGDAAFSGAGQIRFEMLRNVTVVEADTDGDGVADLTIALRGRIGLDATDFILTEAASAIGGAHPFLSTHAPDTPLLHLA